MINLELFHKQVFVVDNNVRWWKSRYRLDKFSWMKLNRLVSVVCRVMIDISATNDHTSCQGTSIFSHESNDWMWNVSYFRVMSWIIWIMSLEQRSWSSGLLYVNMKTSIVCKSEQTMLISVYLMSSIGYTTTCIVQRIKCKINRHIHFPLCSGGHQACRRTAKRG